VESTITDEQLTELVRRTEHAADAYVRGDMDTYLTLVHHARGFTLMPPYGGQPAATRTGRRVSRPQPTSSRAAKRGWSTLRPTSGVTPLSLP
jgi:hypothetical protein